MYAYICQAANKVDHQTPKANRATMVLSTHLCGYNPYDIAMFIKSYWSQKTRTKGY